MLSLRAPAFRAGEEKQLVAGFASNPDMESNPDLPPLYLSLIY
jgi:hypothetical protein